MVRTPPRREDALMPSADSIDYPPSADRDAPLLICYDGSDHAQHAIRSAAGLLGDRKAVVLTVWQPAGDLGAFAGYRATSDTLNFAELDRAGAEAAGTLAEEGARAAQEAGIDAQPVAIEASGPVWKAIVDTADLHHAAVIVIGSRGLTGLRSLLLGSVSNAVVHHTERPTLVIHYVRDDNAD
jgi:nucleotide-binding universal stress UspA family protein